MRVLALLGDWIYEIDFVLNVTNLFYCFQLTLSIAIALLLCSVFDMFIFISAVIRPDRMYFFIKFTALKIKDQTHNLFNSPFKINEICRGFVLSTHFEQNK